MTISQIERFFVMLLYNKGVSEKTYYGSLPTTIDDTCESFVLVDCGNGISDLDSHGFGSVNLYLYARPLKDGYGTKNLPVLNQMENTLNSVIDSNTNPNYSISVNWRDSGYNDKINFHYNVVNIKLIIK